MEPRLSRDELEHGADVVRERWPTSAVDRLRALPIAERAVVLELAALCDAVPVHPETLEPLLELEAREAIERRRFEARMRGRKAGPPPEWLELGERLGVQSAA